MASREMSIQVNIFSIISCLAGLKSIKIVTPSYRRFAMTKYQIIYMQVLNYYSSYLIRIVKLWFNKFIF